MWELDHKESWVLKNWCLWIVVLEKTLESPLDCKEIKPVTLKEITLNIHWKDWWWSWSSSTLAIWWEVVTHWKRFWCWERLKAEGEGDDGWHHQLDGHESEWTPGDGDRQGGLACCDSWGREESDTTERLNRTKLRAFLGGTSGKEPACQCRICDGSRFDPCVGKILEEGMATHFSILAWRIPWTEESGRLQATGSQRVGHDWSNLAHSMHGM